MSRTEPIGISTSRICEADPSASELLLNGQFLVGFGNDLVDDCFDVVRARKGGQLAAEMGMSSETLSATLEKFRDQKFLRVKGNTIVLTNRANCESC